MKNLLNIRPLSKLVAIITLLTFVFFSCKKQESTYADILENDPPKYAGRPDSILFHPGKNRAKISFRVKDPSVRKVVFYWNNRKDSSIYQIVEPSLNFHSVVIEPLEEKYHNIDFYSYYQNGTASIKNTQMGNVYGNSYESSLLNRLIESTVIRNDSLFINWYKAYPDLNRMEVRYTDMFGSSKTILFDAEESTVALPNYKKGIEFSYRSIYLPDSLAIDNFYTDFKNVKL